MARTASFCLLLLCNIGHATGARVKVHNPESGLSDNKLMKDECKKKILETAEFAGFRIATFLGPTGCGAQMADGKLTEEGIARMCTDHCQSNEELLLPLPDFTDVKASCKDDEKSVELVSKIEEEPMQIHDYLQGIWASCEKDEGNDISAVEEERPEGESGDNDGGNDNSAPEGESGDNDGGNDDSDVEEERPESESGDTEPKFSDGPEKDPTKDESDNEEDEDVKETSDSETTEGDKKPTETTDEKPTETTDEKPTETTDEKPTEPTIPEIVPIAAVKPTRTMVQQMKLAYNFAGALAVRTKHSCEKLRTVWADFDYRRTGRLTAEQVVEMLDLLNDDKRKEALDEFQNMQKVANNENYVSFLDIVNQKLPIDESLKCYSEYLQSQK